jgi:hypothetical protein
MLELLRATLAPARYHPVVPDPKPERSRFLTILGFLAVAMGVWGGTFVTFVYDSFDQMVQRSGPPGGPYTYGQRPGIEPWVLAYCAVSALLMAAAGIGLLFRRRWGPALAGFAGAAWTITSFGILWNEVRLLRGYSWSPPGYRLSLAAFAGGALVASMFGLLCLSCLLRRPLREECGAGVPTGLLRIAILAWAGVAMIMTKGWYDWHWSAWGF